MYRSVHKNIFIKRSMYVNRIFIHFTEYFYTNGNGCLTDYDKRKKTLNNKSV